jgi:D-alanyl-D-alanine carboxypeptidase (penicillin-binding protein 5/6)
MRRKYSYTYTGNRKRKSRGGRLLGTGIKVSITSPLIFAGPVVLVITTVLLSRLFAGGAPAASSTDGECPGVPGCVAVLSSSEAPAAPTPVYTRAPESQPVAVAEGGQPLPSIEARAFAVLEPACDALLQERNGDLTLPPASLTKIVTALVAVDRASLDEVVSIDIDGVELSLETDSTVMGMKPGDQLSVRDLLYGLLMRSGNDAALELAEHVAGNEDTFVSLMNQRAAQLGLVDSNFTNAHGLHDYRLYSSAIDMAKLGAALIGNPTLADIVRSTSYQPNWNRGPIENLNLLLNNYPGAIGVKTGFTAEAEQTIVAAAQRDGRTIIVSILGTAFMYEEAAALLDWSFSTEPTCRA